MRKMIADYLQRLPIRNPHCYLRAPRRNFFIGIGWSLESRTRPAVRGGYIQRVETTEYYRELKVRLSLLVSLVFVCAVPPRRRPAGDPSRGDWPNIQKPIYITYRIARKNASFLGRLLGRETLGRDRRDQ